MPKGNLTDPRDLVGAGATAPGMPMPPTKMPNPATKKRKSAGPVLKTVLPKLPINTPKPRIPNKNKPIGPSGEDFPSLSPRNSQKGAKQRMSLDAGPGIR
jgi:hypothetical protein